MKSRELTLGNRGEVNTPVAMGFEEIAGGIVV